MPTPRPERRHIYQNHHLDSPRWDLFKPRPGDIVVSTSYKAGTTLMQTIIVNLIYADSAAPEPLLGVTPWLDMRMDPLEPMLEKLEAQTRRRCIKTHLPLDGLPFYDEVKYVVVGRDGRDVFMSLLNHYGRHTQAFVELLNGPGRVGDPFPAYDGDAHALWANWTTRGWFDWESDGWPYWSHLHHAKTWWEFRRLPNIKLVHYGDCLADLESEMRGIAEFLDIEISERDWPRLVHACRFDTVRANPERVINETHAGFAWEGGAKTFINKGTNGRWREFLSPDELKLYDAAVARTLSPDCARWLEFGSA